MEVSPGKLREEAAAAADAADAGRYSPEPRRAVDELDAVLAISRSLSGKLDLDHVLGVAVGKIAGIVGAEGSSIL